MLLSIIIPTYNERENIVVLLESLLGLLISLDGDYEVIVVDDASPDCTAAIVLEFAKKIPAVQLIRRENKRDLSAALSDGFDSAKGKYLIAMDADLQHDPTAVMRMLALAEDDALGLVVATRYADGGGTSNWHGARLWLSRTATRVAAWILRTKISDPLSGYFLLRRDIWQSIRATLQPSGFKLLLDIIAVSPQLQHAEIGYQFSARTRGDSKLGFIVVWKFFIVLLKLSHKNLCGKNLGSNNLCR